MQMSRLLILIIKEYKGDHRVECFRGWGCWIGLALKQVPNRITHPSIKNVKQFLIHGNGYMNVMTKQLKLRTVLNTRILYGRQSLRHFAHVNWILKWHWWFLHQVINLLLLIDYASYYLCYLHNFFHMTKVVLTSKCSVGSDKLKMVLSMTKQSFTVRVRWDCVAHLLALIVVYPLSLINVVLYLNSSAK